MQLRWIFVLMVLATGARADSAPVSEPLQAVAARASPDSVANGGSASLAASSGVPWNPPGAVSSRRPWEQVVLLPGRIVSLPLVGLGYVVQRSVFFLEERGRIPIAPQAPHAKLAPPISFQLLGIGGRTGLGGAVELHSPPSMGNLPALTTRYAATTTHYNDTQLGASRGPVTLQYGYDWRPRERYFGIGHSSSHDSLSSYAAQGEFVRGTFRWGWFRDSGAAPQRIVFSAFGGPRSQVTRTGRDPNNVSYDVRFPAFGSATLDRRVEHLVYGGSLSTDWRSGKPHWSRGGRLLIGAERYDLPIEGLALHSSQASGQFTRYSIETEAGTSFMRDPRTLRLKLRVNDIEPGKDGGQILPSDLSQLGGRNGLSGYDSGRFHDFDLLVARLAYVFPLARLIEADLHSEWGAVYSDVWKDPKPNTLKNSFGLSLRGRSDGAPHGQLGIDFSPDGMRLVYTFGEVQ